MFRSVRPLLVLCLFALSVPGASAAEPLKLDAATRKRCVQVLRDGLRSDEFWPSIHAAEGLTLGGHGAEVVACLRPRLKTVVDDQQRCGVARELVRAGARRYAQVMLDILAKKDDFGHVHAAESLFKVGGVGDGKLVGRAFDDSESGKLKLMAAAALAKSGNLRGMPYLRETLGDEDPELARTAAWTLGRVGDDTDVPRLRKHMPAADDEFSRAYFEHSLAALGDAEGKQALARNLASQDPAVRTYAATFAGDAQAVEVAPQLVKLLDDETLDVRVRAAQSLLVLSRPTAEK